MEDKVTVILTACNRPDLLEQTLKSFFEFNTYPIHRFIIHEDSGDPEVNRKSMNAYPFIEWIGADHRRGQIVALDELFSRVDTEYVFLKEDDWIFYKPGFIEKSMEIMERNENICMVWLRDREDTNGHPVQEWKEDHGIMSSNYNNAYTGYCFNPGLRRKSHYDKLKSYSRYVRFNKKRPYEAESRISKIYGKQGWKAAILPEGFVRHAGEGRHIGEVIKPFNQTL